MMEEEKIEKFYTAVQKKYRFDLQYIQVIMGNFNPKIASEIWKKSRAQRPYSIDQRNDKLITFCLEQNSGVTNTFFK